MLDIERARSAIRQEGLAGWLFHNVYHRDEIADLVLGVSPTRTNTRPWVCLLSLAQEPVKIVHAIEPGILEHLPGRTTTYATWAEFRGALAAVLPRGKLGADYSPGIPVASFLDHGTALLLQSLGAELAPAGGLVARYLGALSEQGLRTHEAAGRILYRTVGAAWARICAAVRDGRDITEGDVRDGIMADLAAARLDSDAPPIVGAAAHTADPHFGIEGRGAALRRGDVIQFDMWAKEKSAGAVYADISWVGVLAASPTPRQAQVFDAARQAREAALSLLEQRLARKETVSGADLDRAARSTLERLGFASAIRHRTGHSIGTRVHGYGVNLDSVEFPDERLVADGACFSIEPGIYLEGFGMRTEIDCCIVDGRAVVSGGDRQAALLTLG